MRSRVRIWNLAIGKTRECVKILSNISFSNDYQSMTKWIWYTQYLNHVLFQKSMNLKKSVRKNNKKLELFLISEKEYIFIEL
jgi:hypothetical protein